MSSPEESLIDDHVAHKKTGFHLDTFAAFQFTPSKDKSASKTRTDHKCQSECLYGATDITIRPAQCKVTELLKSQETNGQAEWMQVDKPQPPGIPLTKVRFTEHF